MKLFINNENIVPCKDIKTLTNRIDDKSNSDIKNGEMKDIENSTCLDDVTLTSSCSSVENDLMTRKSGLMSGKCIDTIIEKNKANESAMENALLADNNDDEVVGKVANEVTNEDGAKSDSDSESLFVNTQSTNVLNGDSGDHQSDDENNFHLQLSDEDECASQVNETNRIATKPAVGSESDSELFKVPPPPQSSSPPLVLDSVDSSSNTLDGTNPQQSHKIHDPKTNSDHISIDDIINEIDKEIEHDKADNAKLSENNDKTNETSEIIEKTTLETDEKSNEISKTDEKPTETSETNKKLSDKSETVENPTNESPVETLETIENPSETSETVEKPTEKSETIDELIEESEISETLESTKKSKNSENLENNSENKCENVDNECVSENVEKIENEKNNKFDNSELLAVKETSSEMVTTEVSCEIGNDNTAALSENTENMAVKTHDEKSEDVEMNSVTPQLASENGSVSMNSSPEESSLETENTEHMDVDKSSEVFPENESEILVNIDNKSKSSETCKKGAENPEIVDIEMKSLEVTEVNTSCSDSKAEQPENLEIVDTEMKSLEMTEINCSDSNTEVTETPEDKSTENTEINTKLSEIPGEEAKIQETDKTEIVEKNMDNELVRSENVDSSLQHIEKDLETTEQKDLEECKNVKKDSPIEITNQSEEVTADSEKSKNAEISSEKNTTPVIQLEATKDENSKTKECETSLVEDESERESKLKKLLSAQKDTDSNDVDDVILIEDEKDIAAPVSESTDVVKDPVINELNEFIKVTSDVPKTDPVTEPSKTTAGDESQSVIDIDADDTSVPKESVASTTTKEDLPRKRLLSDAEDDQEEKRLKIGDFSLKRRSVDELDDAAVETKRARLEENLEASIPPPRKETKQMLLKLLPILMEEGGSRDSLNVEELILAKVVEHLTEKSVNAQMKEKVLAHEQQLEQYRQKVAHLTKQFNDLSVVFDRLAVDLKSKDRPIAPVKITRSVGLQVSLPILGVKHGPARRKMLRQQSNNVATSVATPPTTPSKPVAPQRQPQNVLATRTVQQPPLQQIASPLKTPPVVSPTKPATATRRKTVSKPTTPITPQPNNSNRADRSVIDLTDEDASSSAGRAIAPMASAAIRVMTPHQLGAQPLNQQPVVGGQRLAYVVPTNVGGANGARQVYIATTTAQGAAPAARAGVRQNYVIRNSNGQLVQTQGVPQNVMIPQQRQSNVVLSNGHPQNVIMTNGQGRAQPLRVATNLQQINVRNTRGLTTQQQAPPANTRAVTHTGRGPNVRTSAVAAQQPPQSRVMPRRSQQNNLDVVPINSRQQISRVHPAPLPQVANQPHMEGWKKIPPRPALKISRSKEGGIQLSWSMPDLDATQHEEVASYQLFAYQELSVMPSTDQWKKVGDVKALPLPMACTLSSFQQGNKYHFAVRALDIHSRVSAFSFTQCITLVNATD